MNKNNRRTLPMVIALLVMVTAMCAVGSAGGDNIVEVEKEISSITPHDDNGHAYYDLHTGVISTIIYDLEVKNVDTVTITVDRVRDQVPFNTSCPGALENVCGGGTCESPLPPGDSDHYTVTYTPTLTELECLNDGTLVEGDIITIVNLATVCAYNWTQLEDCESDCDNVAVYVINTTPTPQPTYSTPPTDVPAQSPIAIVALIGLLGLIGAGMIIGRK